MNSSSYENIDLLDGLEETIEEYRPLLERLGGNDN